MKQTVLFILILIIGALGGLGATELKAVFINDALPGGSDKTGNNDVSLILPEVEDLKEQVNALNDKMSEKDATIAMLEEEISGLKTNADSTSDSKSNFDTVGNNGDMQTQINELRGLYKSLQQQMGTKVEEHVKLAEEKKEEERKAKMKAQMAKFAEGMRKRQDEAAIKHADKMRDQLGLTDSQYEGIKSALLDRAKKFGDMMNLNDAAGNGPVNFSDKMSEIQKEWENAAKSILNPQQYNDFINKKLNKINNTGIAVYQTDIGD